jgi:hypothetical protein
MSGDLVVLGILLLGMLVATGVGIQTRRRRRDETPEDRRRRDKLDLERSRAWLRKNRGVVGYGKWAARGAAGSGIWAAGGAAGLGTPKWSLPLLSRCARGPEDTSGVSRRHPVANRAVAGLCPTIVPQVRQIVFFFVGPIRSLRALSGVPAGDTTTVPSWLHHVGSISVASF